MPRKASAKVKYEAVPATMEHALDIARTVRPEDKAEIEAFSGRDCFHAMLLGIQLSDKPRTWMANGVPLAMFGISTRSRPYRIGTPWMIGSWKLHGHERAFLRHSKPQMYEQAATFAELENFVDARNELTLRWLRWLGFTIDEPAPAGVAGLPFHRFYMRA